MVRFYKYGSLVLLVVVLLISCKYKHEQADKSSKHFKIHNKIILSHGALMRMDKYNSNFIETRPVDVWLPQGYRKQKKYSVLYMHDGQMLFDSTLTWNKQEWKVDEWASKLMNSKMTKDFIVVAIHNIRELRWFDLFPQKAFDFLDTSTRDSISLKMASEGSYKLNGDNYLKFVVEELKPIIDAEFSVYPNKEHTYIMGSSMGGLMSMYAISEYPKVFAGAACLSTHWPGTTPVKDEKQWSDAIFKYMGDRFPKAGSNSIYFDYGTKTLDAHYPKYASKVDSLFISKGYTQKTFRNVLFDETDHSENSWNKRLDVPLTFLLGNK
ncbi:alpha/beta hydrolase [Cognatitamlana onchidii]|uniref:alpha/beta hydrolase n=1 Tax=Cognatitamlana onchidii TaxID=2562860 RepID=UPI0010A67FA9|nr:alpha/beta hydrolase-fold protein [Algibacter onchidii]